MPRVFHSRAFQLALHEKQLQKEQKEKQQQWEKKQLVAQSPPLPTCLLPSSLLPLLPPSSPASSPLSSSASISSFPSTTTTSSADSSPSDSPAVLQYVYDSSASLDINIASSYSMSPFPPLINFSDSSLTRADSGTCDSVNSPSPPSSICSSASSVTASFPAFSLTSTPASRSCSCASSSLLPNRKVSVICRRHVSSSLRLSSSFNFEEEEEEEEEEMKHAYNQNCDCGKGKRRKLMDAENDETKLIVLGEAADSKPASLITAPPSSSSPTVSFSISTSSSPFSSTTRSMLERPFPCSPSSSSSFTSSASFSAYRSSSASLPSSSPLPRHLIAPIPCSLSSLFHSPALGATPLRLRGRQRFVRAGRHTMIQQQRKRNEVQE